MNPVAAQTQSDIADENSRSDEKVPVPFERRRTHCHYQSLPLVESLWRPAELAGYEHQQTLL